MLDSEETYDPWMRNRNLRPKKRQKKTTTTKCCALEDRKRQDSEEKTEELAQNKRTRSIKPLVGMGPNL